MEAKQELDDKNSTINTEERKTCAWQARNKSKLAGLNTAGINSGTGKRWSGCVRVRGWRTVWGCLVGGRMEMKTWYKQELWGTYIPDHFHHRGTRSFSAEVMETQSWAERGLLSPLNASQFSLNMCCRVIKVLLQIKETSDRHYREERIKICLCSKYGVLKCYRAMAPPNKISFWSGTPITNVQKNKNKYVIYKISKETSVYRMVFFRTFIHYSIVVIFV